MVKSSCKNLLVLTVTSVTTIIGMGFCSKSYCKSCGNVDMSEDMKGTKPLPSLNNAKEVLAIEARQLTRTRYLMKTLTM